MHQITFFPVGNGDTILIETDKTIITDIHYRQSAQNDNEDDFYDIGTDIKKACKTSNGHKLDIFINTHPDKDHVSGFSDLFHVGSPNSWSSKNDKILINEIWVTSYTADLTKPTDQAKPLVDEVKRRKKLTGSEANKDGNRLKIISSDDVHTTGTLGDKLSWSILAPNKDEITAADDDDGERNNSSLVIKWSYKSKSPSHILLAGDAEYQVWERLKKEYKPEELEWHILLSPHHCSRTPFSYKDEKGNYIDSGDAWAALTHVQGKGFVVASSKTIKNDADNPPHYVAKNRYIKLLNENGNNGDTRFFNPESSGEKNKPSPVIFKLSEEGIKRNLTNKPKSKVKGAAVVPTQYGM